MRAALVVGFSLMATGLCAEALPAFYRVAGVSADDRLNLRAAPDVGSAVLATLAPDAQGLEVVGFSPDGKWAQLNLGEGDAWSSARYLVHEGDPEWWRGQAALSCHGTEPFWSLGSAPDASVVFTAMGEEPQDLRITWSATPQGGLAGVLGWQLAGPARNGFAVLRSDRCSDGMSDRNYGITLDLFLAGGAAPLGLRGCCSLTR